MSAPVIQDDGEHTAGQVFGPDRDGDFYDLERQIVKSGPADDVRYGQFNVTEDQGQLPEVNHEANPRSPERQPEQGTRKTTQSPPKYHGFLSQLWPFAMFLKQPRDKPDSTARPVLQCCFLCLRGRRQQPYAVLVPCFRPKPRYRIKRIKPQNGTKRSENKVLMDSGSDSDSTVYKKLIEACYQHQLKLKRWIPFYGIVDVHEVKFRFLGTKDESDRCRVHIYPLNIDKLREEAEKTIVISRHPDYWEAYGCHGGWHSDTCAISMDFNAEPCMMEQTEAAQQRKNNLDTHYLLRDCARDPQKADSYETLKGMAQESPIIHLNGSEIDDKTKVFGRKDELPGLEFVLGWRVDRMECELPFFVVCILSLTLLIWFGVIAGGMAGEWSVSTAVGQLALGSLALLVAVKM